MQSQRPSPRVIVEVPRQWWLQAWRIRNAFASSSPIRIQIEDDVHAGEVGCRRLNQISMFMNDDIKMVNLTYFTEQSSKVHIMVDLHGCT